MASDYRIKGELVAVAIGKCWRNARSLLKAAEMLKSSGLHAPALSLAILVLEETGKIQYLDSLLFSNKGDARDQTFHKAFKSHSLKLDGLRCFPDFFSYLATFKSKWAEDAEYMDRLRRMEVAYRNQLEAVVLALRLSTVRDLDSWKQRGFYTGLDSKGVAVEPSEDVSADACNQVVILAGLIIDILDSVFEESFEAYERFLKSAQTKVTRKQLAQVRELAKRKVSEIV